MLHWYGAKQLCLNEAAKRQFQTLMSPAGSCVRFFKMKIDMAVREKGHRYLLFMGASKKQTSGS
jgi:hypothetical protein